MSWDEQDIGCSGGKQRSVGLVCSSDAVQTECKTPWHLVVMQRMPLIT